MTNPKRIPEILILILSLFLIGCGISEKDKTNDMIKEYMKCPESGFLTYLGSNSCEEYKNLNLALLNQEQEKCRDWAFDLNLSDEEISRFSVLCIQGWLDRHSLEPELCTG
jgi:hypothetical protein